MKIALTGAAGGIGRSLMTVLGDVHEMTGIVRTPRAGGPAGRYVAFADKPALAGALSEADCVIHCARDARAKRRDYLAANHALNREILAGALEGRCRLFIFVSSQVVYSGVDPVDANGYREDQPLTLTEKADNYTRLKIESEREVIAACEEAGVAYLILRPTIVMGPGLDWSTGIVAAYRGAVIGIRNRTMNLIHVDDLSRQVGLLIERGIRNEIFNLGTRNVPTEDYFRQVGVAAGLRTVFLPNLFLRAAKRAIPSTIWIFARNVAINDDKIADATGFRSDRALADYFPRRPVRYRPKTLGELKEAAAGAQEFRTFGRGYHRWFNRPAEGDLIEMRGYAGVVALEGDRVRVKAGTPLLDLCIHLDKNGLALAILPEFLGITAGACFFVDVHGSSSAHFSLYEFIDEIRYLDDRGEEVVSPRDEAAWAALRNRRNGFVLTEVTFRCIPATLLANAMGWEDEVRLADYLGGAFRSHHAMVIHWYPRYRRLLVYRIDHVDSPVPGAAPSVAPFRGLPYHAQRLLLALRLRGRKLQVDRWYRILGPWRAVPFERTVTWLQTRNYDKWRDMEMVMRLEDGRAFIHALRERLDSGALIMRRRAGVGIRFSHAASEKQDYAWIEFVSDDPRLVEAMIALARDVASGPVSFHRGKYIPLGEPA